MAVNADGIDVRLFPAEITALLKGPEGPVYRYMTIEAEAVRQEARRRCPVSKRTVSTERSGPGRDSGGRFTAGPRQPGALRDSIVKRPAKSSTGDIIWYVGSTDPVALYVHEGTIAHPIVARRRPRLVFYWAKVGRVVAFKRVFHRGTRPNRFLTEALSILRRR